MAACEWLPAESRRTQASGPEAGMSEYDTDILIWSERQAALLRRVAAGERVNDQVDWENVIERSKAWAASSGTRSRGCWPRHCATC